MAKNWSSNDAVFALQALRPALYIIAVLVVIEVFELRPKQRG